jgi:hypothetical protein
VDSRLRLPRRLLPVAGLYFLLERQGGEISYIDAEVEAAMLPYGGP